MKIDQWAWMCVGSVRGWCRVHHKSAAASLACIDRDNRACAAHGGYSDRRPRVTQFLGRGTWTTDEPAIGALDIELAEAYQAVRS